MDHSFVARYSPSRNYGSFYHNIAICQASGVRKRSDRRGAIKPGRMGNPQGTSLLPTGLLLTLRGRHLRLDSARGQVGPGEAFLHGTDPRGVIRVVVRQPSKHVQVIREQDNALRHPRGRRSRSAFRGQQACPRATGDGCRLLADMARGNPPDPRKT